MTKAGHMVGTLEYMAPEQMRGQEADTRSDVYALGILLYELLTGRAPFTATSEYELMRAQIEDAPPAPRLITPEIPEAVERVLLRALAKDPAARFQTAGEFRAALHGCLRAAAASAGNPARGYSAHAPEDPSGPNDPAPAESTISRFPLALVVRLSRQLNWKHYAGMGAILLALTGTPFVFRSVRNQPVTAPPSGSASAAPAPAPPPTLASERGNDSLPGPVTRPPAPVPEIIPVDRLTGADRLRPMADDPPAHPPHKKKAAAPASLSAAGSSQTVPPPVTRTAADPPSNDPSTVAAAVPAPPTVTPPPENRSEPAVEEDRAQEKKNNKVGGFFKKMGGIKKVGGFFKGDKKRDEP